MPQKQEERGIRKAFKDTYRTKSREETERIQREAYEALKNLKESSMSSTLIIGAKCSNGIVIGSDRKIVRGGETTYSNKIFEFDVGGKVIFAAEGLTGIRDDFFFLLNSEIKRRRVVDTLYEIKLVVEDIIANLTERYKDRVDDPSPVGVLMGGLENLNNGSAQVYYVHGVGYGEQITFRCSGHGADHAYSIAKFLCGPQICENMIVDEVAKRIAYTISWVSEEVDSTVGGLPSIAVINNEQNEIHYLKDDVLSQIEQNVKKHRKNLPSLIGF